MKRRFGIIGILLVAGYLLGGCSFEVPEQLFADAMRAFEKEHNYILAEIQFDKFINKYPDHEYIPSALLTKAKCSWALRDYDKALMACDRVVAAFAGTNWEIDALLLKGQILEDQGNIENTVAFYKGFQAKASRNIPLYQEVSMRLGGMYVRFGKWTEAVEAYDAMIESASIDPRLKPTLMVFKGRSLAEQGLTEDARGVFTEIQKQYPETPDAIRANVEIAKLLQNTDPEASKRYFDAALSAYQQIAEEIEAATYESPQAGPSDATGAQMMPSGPSIKDQRKLDIAFQVAGMYAYMGMYDVAIEKIEELKNEYVHNPRIYHFITSQLDIIRQEKAMRESESGNAAIEEAVSAATATLGSVSP